MLPIASSCSLWDCDIWLWYKLTASASHRNWIKWCRKSKVVYFKKGIDFILLIDKILTWDASTKLTWTFIRKKEHFYSIKVCINACTLSTTVILKLLSNWVFLDILIEKNFIHMEGTAEKVIANKRSIRKDNNCMHRFNFKWTLCFITGWIWRGEWKLICMKFVLLDFYELFQFQLGT